MQICQPIMLTIVLLVGTPAFASDFGDCMPAGCGEDLCAPTARCTSSSGETAGLSSPAQTADSPSIRNTQTFSGIITRHPSRL